MPAIKISYKGDQDAHWGGWKGEGLDDRERLLVFSPGRGDKNLEIESSDFPTELIGQPGIRVAIRDGAVVLFEPEGGTLVVDTLRCAGARPA